MAQHEVTVTLMPKIASVLPLFMEATGARTPADMVITAFDRELANVGLPGVRDGVGRTSDNIAEIRPGERGIICMELDNNALEILLRAKSDTNARPLEVCFIDYLESLVPVLPRDAHVKLFRLGLHRNPAQQAYML